jgi:hypothetical protein
MIGAARWHEFAYEQTDIPAGITIREWRKQRATLARRRRRLYQRLRDRIRIWRRCGAAHPPPSSGERALA